MNVSDPYKLKAVVCIVRSFWYKEGRESQWYVQCVMHVSLDVVVVFISVQQTGERESVVAERARRGKKTADRWSTTSGACIQTNGQCVQK